MVLFSVNGSDDEHDDAGIFLHFGDTRIKVANSVGEYKSFVKGLDKMTKEIEEICNRKFRQKGRDDPAPHLTNTKGCNTKKLHRAVYR